MKSILSLTFESLRMGIKFYSSFEVIILSYELNVTCGIKERLGSKI